MILTKPCSKMLNRFITILLILGVTISVNAQESKVHDSLFNLYKNAKQDTVKARLLNSLYWEVAYSDLSLSKTYAEDLIDIAKKNNLKNSLGRGYNNLAGYYEINTINDSARYYLQKANAIFKELKDDEFLYRINRSFALLDYTEGNLNQALERTKNNLELSKKIGDSSYIAKEYNFIGGIYSDLGNIKSANEYKFKALKIYEKIGDKIGEADTLISISVILLYDDDKDYQKRIDYATRAYEIYKAQNDKFYQSFSKFHIGQSYYLLNEYEIALKHLIEGYDLANELESNRLLSMLSLKIGQTYNEINDLENSEHYLNLALKYTDSINNKQHYIGILNSMAFTYNRQKKPQKALTISDEALKLLDSVDNLNLKQKAFEARYEAHEILGNYKNALANFKQSESLKDSLFSIEKTKEIKKIRALYETEKKEQQIQLQKNEINLLTIKNKNSNLQRLLLAFGLALALIAVYAFYQRNKRNKLAKENAHAELEFKTKELTTHALHLAKKNEVLNDLKQKAKVLKEDANADPGYQMLIQTINFDLQDDNNWENFSKYFEQVHKGFNEKAQQKFPAVTSNDLRLMALLKMNLSSKEIANILNISSDGIKKARQRLRKKMGIDSNESLEAIVIAI